MRRPARQLVVAVVAMAVSMGSVAGCRSGGDGSSPTPGGTVAAAAAAAVTVVDRPSGSEPTAHAPAAAAPTEVAYGPDPMQTMDVYVSASGEPRRGTILYIHGGAWTGGSKGDGTSAEAAATASPGFGVVIAELQEGWDVVSIDYRLATRAAGPGIRAPELLADVDRAVRFTRRNAATLGLDLSTLVVAGGSAGGHLALVHAQGAPTDEFEDPDLPGDLAAVPATVDGVAALVAPTDLDTMWRAGGIAPGGQEALLGCTLAAAPTISGMPPCDQTVVDRFSPRARSQAYLDEERTLPPAYLAYGGEDTLVQMDTQGTPTIALWSSSAAPGTTWVDHPATGTHHIDDQMNPLAFDAWLDRVASGNWAAPATGLTVPTTTAP